MKASGALSLILAVAAATSSSAFVSPSTQLTTPQLQRDATGHGLVKEVPKQVAQLDVSPVIESSTAVASVRGGEGSQLMARLKVGFYFGLWYALNVGYNIHNKKTLNALPLPYTLALMQLFLGIPYVLILWITRLRKAPGLSAENVKDLSPMAAAHMVAHLSAVVSLGAGAVSFTHIVKAGEPFFTAIFSGLFLKQFFHPMVYATLIPVVAGVALASMKELTFSYLALGAAMTSNVASAMRGIIAKTNMSKPIGTNMTPQNLYAILTMLAFLMLAPISLFMEGQEMQNMWDAAVTAGSSPQVLGTGIVLSGLFYYLYNEVAFLCLDKVHPITHAVGNTIKRVVLIGVSVVVFKSELTPMAMVGSALAVGGVLLYSLVKDYYAQQATLSQGKKVVNGKKRK